MRRADREIREFDRMLAVADACDCCRLGLLDDAGAYIVPLNFGYEAEGEKLTLYFHGAGQGKKIDLIREQKSASFEMDTRHALVEGGDGLRIFLPVPERDGKRTIRLIEEYEEKVHGLQAIMAHYSRTGVRVRGRSGEPDRSHQTGSGGVELQGALDAADFSAILTGFLDILTLFGMLFSLNFF